MSECLGCYNQAQNRERDFQTLKQKAIEYAKQYQQDVVIYSEGQEWHFVTAKYAAEAGILYWREMVQFDQRTAAEQVH